MKRYARDSNNAYYNDIVKSWNCHVHKPNNSSPDVPLFALNEWISKQLIEQIELEGKEKMYVGNNYVETNCDIFILFYVFQEFSS